MYVYGLLSVCPSVRLHCVRKVYMYAIKAFFLFVSFYSCPRVAFLDAFISVLLVCGMYF